jgi:hypothetical protein
LSIVNLGLVDVSGLDFGFNFDLVVNTRSDGQGSLGQFMLNATALGNDAGLAQAGSRLSIANTVEPLPAGKETSIFMIPDGLAHAGLRAGLVDQLTGGVAIIPQPFVADPGQSQYGR